MDVRYVFVNYGEDLNPQPNTLILDVGMKMVRGVIDHHHSRAEAECAASLVVKYPSLVLDHLNLRRPGAQGPPAITIITHRNPDFDAVSSIFLALKLLEVGRPDRAMQAVARYAKIVDSASYPKSLSLISTPHTILRALFTDIHGDPETCNQERVKEGLKLMRFLYSRAEEGYDLMENRRLFSGVDRYQQAMRKAEYDYFRYLEDVQHAERVSLVLPRADGRGRKTVDGLFIRRSRSFLLKDWARLDRIHPPQNNGFSFLLSSLSETRYMLGVDADHGVNLRGLAPRLDAREAVRREERGLPFANRWYDGNCAFFENRIVVSPRDGTILRYEEVLDEVRSFGQP